MEVKDAQIKGSQIEDRQLQDTEITQEKRSRTTARGRQTAGEERDEARADGAVKRRDVLLAKGLGWFSIGLGVAEIAATRPLARLIGLRDDGMTRWVMRGMGVREITSGVGILSRPRLAGWVWSRVGGDAVDLALLGLSLRARRNSPGRLLGAIGAVLGVAALDVYDSLRLGRRPGRRHARNKHPK